VWSSLIEMGHGVQAAASAGHVAETALGVINILLLMFPWVGGLLLLDMIFRGPILAAWRRWRPGAERPSPPPSRHRLNTPGSVQGRHRRAPGVKTPSSC
ncbi:MAG: hypothetical protein ACRDSH_14505, partial [Pseudonocardiaceae bacterium]